MPKIATISKITPLIDAVKKAKEPNRYLDVQIFLAVYYGNFNPTQDEIAMSTSPGVPKFTADVGEAMMLFPAEYSYTFSRNPASKKPKLKESFNISVTRVGGFDSYYPALAILQGALSAIKHKEESKK